MKKNILLVLFLLVTSTGYNMPPDDEDSYFSPIKKLLTFFTDLNNQIDAINNNANKNKIKAQALEINGKLQEVIAAKESLLQKLQSDPEGTKLYDNEIKTLKSRVNELNTKLDNCSDLFLAVGADSKAVQMALYKDFDAKINLLQVKETLGVSSQNDSPAKARRELIKKIKEGISLLKESLNKISSFEQSIK